MGVVLGIVCTRFRDIPPIVTNLIQVAFFFTPVMWSPEIIGDRSWIAEYNPLYHIIEIVRAPLLGRPVEYNPLYHIIEIVRAPLLGRPVAAQSWLWVGAMLVTGFAVAQFLMSRYRSRVPYWL
jgi:ABC-2 type transport system permease protein